ncbi:hypothetical protein M9435_003691 [Picochlorum sp. BPE23]|nr:hypothetical protein M9435_003691 [Picochlorum sp. BPE23]
MLTRQSKRKLESQVIGNELDGLHSGENGGAFGKKGRKKSLHGRATVEDHQEHGDTARLQLIEKLRRKWPDALAPRCRLIGSLHSPEKGSTSHEEAEEEEEEEEEEQEEGESNEHGLILSKGVDEKGYLIVCPHYMLTSRYRITRVIGKGTFAKVVECFDVETKRDVAVKIVRNTSKYTMAAMNEIIVIMTMMQYDPMGLFDFVRLGHWFHYPRGGHVTMVFPKLGKSLYETMERNDNPFPVYMIRKYLKSLLQTLAYMHSLGIVHTDVKPENVLHDDVEYEVIKSEHPGLASEFPTSDRLTLIDFGSAQLKERSHPKLVSTRHYRAPEVLLGLSWSSSIDVWSVGCLLLELVMGDTFFYNQDYNASPETKDLEHLGMIERAVGTIPRVLVEQSVQAEKGKYFFRENGTLRYPNSSTSEKSRRAYWETMKLEGYFCSDVNPSLRADGKETRDLLDLARRMLHWLPEKRCTFVEALKHPFFLDD